MGWFFPRADPGEVDIRGSRGFIFVLDLFVAGAGVMIVGWVFSCARLFPAAHLPWPVCCLSFVRGGAFSVRPCVVPQLR